MCTFAKRFESPVNNTGRSAYLHFEKPKAAVGMARAK